MKNPRLLCDHHKVSSANQRRMRTDPFETLLMNMGMSIENGEDDDNDDRGGGDGDGEDGDQRGLQCRTS